MNTLLTGRRLDLAIHIAVVLENVRVIKDGSTAGERELC
jgi:hypothetical protein